MCRKKISLHIGVTHVKPDMYGGWDGQLDACQKDAEDMRDLALSRGFKPKILLDDNATRQNVLDFLEYAAKKVGRWGEFFVTYSGHGGQFKNDENAPSWDDEAWDQTWCLWDGHLFDDELYVAWSKFKKRARVTVFSDSCHSGTMLAMIQLTDRPPLTGKQAQLDELLGDIRREKSQTLSQQIASYEVRKSFYDGLLIDISNVVVPEPVACIRLISACQDTEYAVSGTDNGAFTLAVNLVWGESGFDGGYDAFRNAVQEYLPYTMHSNYQIVGLDDSSVGQDKVLRRSFW